MRIVYHVPGNADIKGPPSLRSYVINQLVLFHPSFVSSFFSPPLLLLLLFFILIIHLASSTRPILPYLPVPVISPFPLSNHPKTSQYDACCGYPTHRRPGA